MRSKGVQAFYKLHYKLIIWFHTHGHTIWYKPFLTVILFQKPDCAQSLLSHVPGSMYTMICLSDSSLQDSQAGGQITV